MKLHKDLNDLVAKGIISEEVAIQISNYYKEKGRRPSNAIYTIFGVLGSALVGLGIILILAHNWDDFSIPIKTIFAFLPLVVGQFVAGFVILKQKSRVWKESSGTFLFFAIGASIALISQIYHIPGDLGPFLLIWTLLGIPLVYLLDSKSVAMLVLVFATYYAVEVGYGFNRKTTVPWFYVLMILGSLPFYIRALRKSLEANTTGVLNWIYVISLIIALGTFITENWPLGILMYVLLFGLFYNLGHIKIFRQSQLRRNSFMVSGSLGTVVLLLMMSFQSMWKEIEHELLFYNSMDMMILMLLFISALIVLIFTIRRQETIRFNLIQYVFIIFGILFGIGSVDAGIATVLCNILLLVIGLYYIKIGVIRTHFGLLNYGLLIVSITIICRFFDTDMSFVFRGLVFVLVGLGFFLTNYIMLKKGKAQ